MAKPDLYVIYLTTDLTNGLIYIGQHKCRTCYEGGYCGYLGSGTLFTKVKKARGEEAFERIVLERAESKAEADRLEEEAIALHGSTNREVGYNILAGSGTSSARSLFVHTCEVHGEQLHQGVLEPKCCVCVSNIHLSSQVCPIHGESLHRGPRCLKCSLVNRQREDLCPIHGVSTFQGATCRRCVADKAFSAGECETHGAKIFHGKTCTQCTVESRYSEKECFTHGVTRHSGDKCCKCQNQPNFKVCPTHGETKHLGDSCFKCTAKRSFSLKICPVHGESKHKGTTCMKCATKAKVTLIFCKIHGEETKHQHGKCLKCRGGSNQHTKRKNV